MRGIGLYFDDLDDPDGMNIIVGQAIFAAPAAALLTVAGALLPLINRLNRRDLRQTGTSPPADD